MEVSINFETLKEFLQEIFEKRITQSEAVKNIEQSIRCSITQIRIFNLKLLCLIIARQQASWQLLGKANYKDNTNNKEGFKILCILPA
ncbi:MAG: hypothetical protein HQK63_14260 [Desulfamplus sp.]|nr:hypothetical protein [Desulfamplus sp.]